MSADPPRAQAPRTESDASSQLELSEEELKQLLHQALEADERDLWHQTRSAGLTPKTLLDALRARAPEIATVRFEQPIDAQVDLENATKQLEALRSRNALVRMIRRLQFWRPQQRKLEAWQNRAADALRDQTEAIRRHTRLELAVVPAIRQLVNQNEDERFDTTLGDVAHEGLAELDDQRYAVPTAARKQLDWLLENMPGGSIGLAGPRGAGKSTLIRIECPNPEEPLWPPGMGKPEGPLFIDRRSPS